MSTRLHCEICGELLNAATHASCRQRAELEPPRYCPRCARRMVVQVDPMGWSARCPRHGDPRPAPGQAQCRPGEQPGGRL